MVISACVRRRGLFRARPEGGGAGGRVVSSLTETWIFARSLGLAEAFRKPSKRCPKDQQKTVLGQHSLKTLILLIKFGPEFIPGKALFCPHPKPSVAIFDFGGVLIDWNPRHLYRKLIPDPGEMERFLADRDHAGWHTVQDAGGDPAEATRRLKADHPGQEALIGPSTVASTR